MSSLADAALEGFAKDVVRNARRKGQGTKMAKSLKYVVRNGQLTFQMLEYGIYQDVGVGGSERTIAVVARWQQRAINIGYIDKRFKYDKKRPPMSAFKQFGKGAYPIAKGIFEMGFPSVQQKNLRWFQKPLEDALNKFEGFITDEDLENLFDF